MIGGRRQLKGRKSGDRRVRVERPHSAVLPLLGPRRARRPRGGVAAADADGPGVARVRQVVFGRPLANEEEIGERLSKKKALAIFSSDAISSSAYATEEILRVLLVAGAGALLVSVQVAIAIAILLAVVSVSYRQVCRAYPNGGGAYVVARTNLAPVFGPDRRGGPAHRLRHDRGRLDGRRRSRRSSRSSRRPTTFRIEIAFVSIALITIANLRGLRESGNIFAVPTYLFVGLALAIVAIGVVRIATGTAAPSRPSPMPLPFGHRDARCPVAAQGVRRRLGGADRRRGHRQRRARLQAARSEERREHHDDRWRSCSAILFVGLTIFAVAFGLRPTGEGGPSIVALAARDRVRRGLAARSTCSRPARRSSCSSPRTRASTPSRASPRSCPRTATCPASSRSAATGWRTRGGSCCSRPSRSACSWLFGGDTHALIPLYSVGVFLCFTLSQLGMVKHWLAGPGAGLALAAGGQRVGRRADGRGPRHRRLREVRRWRVPRRDPRAGPRRDDAVHQPPVRPLGAAARGRPGTGRRAAPPRGTGRRPDRRSRSGGRSRRSTSAARSTTTSAPCTSPTDPEGAAAVREAFERQVPGVPLVVVESPVPGAGRAAPRVPRRPRRGLAAGQARSRSPSS